MTTNADSVHLRRCITLVCRLERRPHQAGAQFVGGDVVPMNRGDFLPQAGWNWHAQ